ncbi:esterase/lipase family protein [Streptomyces sp. NPDC048639]|uniref:esterase/lipase family protein n=1 Tax=Streptomyces sp. NPDC048639 TaxID=3365581 RepID=UPI003711898B
MRALPFLPSLLRPSVAFIKATALDLAILAGHAVLYPTGVIQESPPTVPAPTQPAELTGSPGTGPSEAGAAAAPGAATATEAAETPRLPTDGTPRASRVPVLLLHGFIDNRSVFVLLRRSLRQHGWDHVEALNYSPLSCDIRAAASLLGKHIEEVCERTGHSKVDVVGHSLGGLIARYYVQRLGGDVRVRSLVTLGTPHSGTRAVPLLSAHPIVRQMRPDSDVIQELAEPAEGCTTHFVSFWSDLDQLMAPLETAQVHHPDLIAQNVQVSGIGHLALPVHGAVAAGIREALDAAGSAGGASEAASVA